MAWWPGVHSYSQCILAMEVSTFAWYWYSHLWVILRTARIIMLGGLDDFDLGFSRFFSFSNSFLQVFFEKTTSSWALHFWLQDFEIQNLPVQELHLQQLQLNTYHAAAAFTACKRTTTSVPEKWPWTLEILEELQGRLFWWLNKHDPFTPETNSQLSERLPLKMDGLEHHLFPFWDGLCSGVRC